MKRENRIYDPLLNALRKQSDNPPEPDMPSARVWANIREANRKRRRRRFLWWWLLPLALGGSWWGLQTSMPDLKYSAQTIEIQENVDHNPSLPHENAIRLKPNKPSNASFDPGGTAPSSAPKKKLKAKAAPLFFEEKTEITAPLVAVAPLEESPSAPERSITQRPVVLPPADLPSKPLFLTSVESPGAPASPGRIADIKPTKHRVQWEWSLLTGPLHTSRILKPKPEFLRERGAWGLQFQALTAMKFRPHWAFETGLGTYSQRLIVQRVALLTFRTDAERFDPARGVYISTQQETLNTAVGPVELNYDISRAAGEPIQNLSKVRVQFKTDESIRYLRIPFQLRYTAGTGKGKTHFRAGFGLNIKTNYDIDVTVIGADLLAIRQVTARAQLREKALAGALFDASVGIAGNIPLGPRQSMVYGIEYRKGLQPANKIGTFRSYPRAIGLQAGLQWNLGK